MALAGAPGPVLMVTEQDNGPRLGSVIKMGLDFIGQPVASQ